MAICLHPARFAVLPYLLATRLSRPTGLAVGRDRPDCPDRPDHQATGTTVSLGAQLISGQLTVPIGVELEERILGISDLRGIEFAVSIRIECRYDRRNRVVRVGRRSKPELIGAARRRRHQFFGAELAIPVLVELQERLAGIGESPSRSARHRRYYPAPP